jgi:type I restriction enzyme M protein
MTPHLEEVEKKKAGAVALKEKISSLRKRGANDTEISAVREALAAAEKSAREAQAKADAIDAAVYDLKAVNPRARVDQDMRSPTEIIESIAKHGLTIDTALKRLGVLLSQQDNS